ncbi:M81 family metallopeptidase [Aestuariispira insulae]|uniref:Microcystinase C n=1 Tax=Aestuariispira insulae TaxID=1461337 RepID=A0A3D9HNE6_9PROT|nr:M81 family metallopeptidase [Aestuariispira insulae]RED51027.1 microcystin degradation protein MlrC [Aestuariispira insulae]
MARIAVGGFQHETNTFAPVKASFDKFERADGWPALCRGDGLFDGVEGVHIPLTGAIDALRDACHELVPLLWCSATPSAHVTKDAFERISEMFLEDIRTAGPLDGIYLDLHGAMVTEHLEDGEGELLRRIRDLVGADLPIAVSLDLHANVTPQMIDFATIMDIFRTYPHVDMGATGARTARHLNKILCNGVKPFKAFRQADFLIALTHGCTYMEPAKRLYEVTLPEILSDNRSLMALSFAAGFHLADIHDAGPSVVAYAGSQEAADKAADAMLAAVNAKEPAFGGKIYEAADGVREAKKLSANSSRPVIIADTQDNPGGGGPGDTTGMLRAMVAGNANGAVVAMIIDPSSADQAHEAGEGASVTLDIGGKEFPEDSPYRCECTVLKLGDGKFTGTGPMWGGAKFQLGKMALVETNGIKVIIASKAMQAGDTSMLRHLGLEPAEQPIIALKSSVHFRADFQPLAEEVLVGAAPGPVYADPGKLDFKRLRSGVRR